MISYAVALKYVATSLSWWTMGPVYIAKATPWVAFGRKSSCWQFQLLTRTTPSDPYSGADLYIYICIMTCSLWDLYGICTRGRWKPSRPGPNPLPSKNFQWFLGFQIPTDASFTTIAPSLQPLINLLKGKPSLCPGCPEATSVIKTLQKAFVGSTPGPSWPREALHSRSGCLNILSQQQENPPRLHPCAFFFLKLSLVEQNYDIGNGELLAIKLALRNGDTDWRGPATRS